MNGTYLCEKYGDTMTISVAAEVLHSHPVHVRAMCREGVLPAIKVGSRWRILTAKFAAMLDGEDHE